MFNRLFCKHEYSKPYFYEDTHTFESYCKKCDLRKSTDITDEKELNKQIQKRKIEIDAQWQEELKILLKRYGTLLPRKHIYSEDGIIYIQNFTDSDYYIAWIRKDEK